ncbi:unnamed protein product [Owenia fusiformis]|uniref:Vacuolar protein sorting-associated protein 41 homolog n=1 Tax=Owenia fusiformis TaxID=6347 RepID=A0A8J1UKA6_OWEFU|nr:unnamed protein product [Owenia fusiformis]
MAEKEETKLSENSAEDDDVRRDEDESETESEESEEEVEPKLKYERIGNDLLNILTKDAASCIAVHEKFLALGTHWGMIHILDHCGNNIVSKELPAHQTTVNQMSIDENGDFLASCSDDGRVVINGLYTNDNNQVLNFDRPVKAVSMDPHFFKHGSGKHFVTGDDKLVLNEKGFLGRNKTVVLHQGEGAIRNIQWRGSFIAWANDQGVKIYDMSSKRRITFIARDNPKLRPELYRCNLCWKDTTTLLIGWGDSVKVCVIKERLSHDARDLPNRYVEIVSMFTTDFFISGIAPYGSSQLICLSFDIEEGAQGEAGKYAASRPHLRIIEPHMDYYDELSNDALSIRGFQEYRCNDYHLECVVSDNIYFIVSPKDIVAAKPRDEDDHITWLLDNEMFEEAMVTATAHSKDLKKHNFQDIGKAYLAYLLEEQSYSEAAQLCSRILGKSKDLWEEEVYKFAQIRQLKSLAPYVPREEPRLDPAIYEMILNEFLQTDEQGFQRLIKEWPSSLYNIQTIVNAVLDRLGRDNNNAVLLHSLAALYTADKRYDKALAMYLRLKHKDVFELIHKHNLFDSISDKIVRLMDFDADRAVTLLLDNLQRIPIEKVVHQLEDHPKMLHIYLDRLFRRDPHSGQDFHELQVKLYAEYDRTKLLSFLRSSNYYPLQKAMEVCTQRKFIPEMVFLLGRMGNTKQALKLITNELRDVDRAIDFCKEHHDKELWEDLISYSIDKPAFITGLLNNIGTHVDPIILIQKIEQGMEIPGLRDSLVKILQDYNLQISLREGCKKILVADCFGLLDKLVKTQRKGISVEEDQVCQACHEKLIVNDLRYASNIITFFCRHSFHEDCLPVHAMETCSICVAQKRGPGRYSMLRK